jgi:putative Holliday junction resolvase
MDSNDTHIVALDVGEKRIGVATAHTVARLASPLVTLQVGDDIVEQIMQLLTEQSATALVVGLPRGMEGQDTAQTKTVQDFIEGFRQQLQIPVYWQDEAVTSILSEAALQAKKGNYSKEDIDAMAATLILDDFLATHKEAHA